MKKNLLFVVTILSAAALGETFYEPLDLSKTKLTCTKNIASAQNVWDVTLEKTITHPALIYAHRFWRNWVYEDGAKPEICKAVAELQGKSFEAKVSFTQRSSKLTQCVEGGNYYCKRWSCFLFHNEFANLEFPNGLIIKSSAYDQSPEVLHTGWCE